MTKPVVSFLQWSDIILVCGRFRNALKRGGYRGEIPYWESSMDQFLPEPSHSALFIENEEGFGVSTVFRREGFICVFFCYHVNYAL